MVSVLTVTYGERWHLLQEVLCHLVNEKFVDRILVINNGVNYNIDESIKSLRSNKLELINFDNNYGSAQAFKTGLQHLMNSKDTEFIWLLDDDNLPAANALEILLANWKLNPLSENKEKKLALLSIRKERRYLVRVAYGESVSNNFPHGNLFLGFDILEFPLILFQKICRYYATIKQPILENVKIPMAPYGGLLFHKEALDCIGLPDGRFFVYVDDFDFTYRFTKNDGEIWLIPESEVIDIDKAWIFNTRHNLFRSRYLEQADYRSYLAVRNFTFFAKKNLVKNKLIFGINICVYLFYIGIIAIFQGKIKELGLFWKAVKHGYWSELEDFNLEKEFQFQMNKNKE